MKFIKYIVMFTMIGCSPLQCYVNELKNQNENQRIEITNKYIKTGWFLYNTTGATLTIQEIYPYDSDYKEYSDFEDKGYERDSCYTIFALNNEEYVYFNKNYRKWDWKTICNESIKTSTTYKLKTNTYYRVMKSYQNRKENSPKVYFYVDKKGEVTDFVKPLHAKNI